MKRDRIIYLTSSLISFFIAGLIVTGNIGLEMQPLNEAACFSVVGMMGFLFLFASVTKDKK
jgi:hypothetical protein